MINSNFTITLTSNSAWSVYNFRAGLIRALQDKGFRIVVIAPEDTFSNLLREMNCTVLNIQIDNKGTNPLRDIKTLFSFWSYYRRIHPTVILHYTVKPVIYGTLAARFVGTPVINIITGLGTAFLNKSWLKRFVKILYKISQKTASKVFMLNKDDYLIFDKENLLDMNKADYLPGEGITLEQFQQKSLCTQNGFIFILLGRLLWDKGVGEYVKAARSIKLKYPHTRFQLLGFLDSANRSAISRRQIDIWGSEGIVEYLGVKDDVRDFIAASDCVVLPSYREGVPRVLLEAAAIGRPIITTDAVGCREVVDDGINGYLCRAKDENDLALKMEQMINLPFEARQKMGKYGRLKVEREFDEKIVIAKILTAIDDIINARPCKS